MGKTTRHNPATPEEVWSILREVSKNQKETDRRMQETDRQMQETDRKMQETDRQMQETDRKMQETDRKMQETDKKIAELIARQDRRMAELSASQKKTGDYIEKMTAKTDRQITETSKELKKAKYLFTTEWGQLVESLVQGNLLKLLKKKGIHLKTTGTNQEGIINYIDEQGQKREKYCEIDIIAKNGTEIVAVEVKSTMRVEDVNSFLEVLKDFTQFLPEYKGKKVYGAMAYLKMNERADIYAERKGLFVIKATGDSASITNKKGFQPKIF